jgi:type 1 fimbriae regulatory protein FimB/type 1 fimbriae regulatory protein FimE
MTIYGTDITDWGPQMRANLKLAKPSPTPVNGTVPPKRARNADVRPREYLTPKEVERLIKAARARGRYGARDATAILVTYRHGLRASEFAELRWDQVDFNHHLLHVRWKKNGISSVHPLSGTSCGRCGRSGASTMQPAMCL